MNRVQVAHVARSAPSRSEFVGQDRQAHAVPGLRRVDVDSLEHGTIFCVFVCRPGVECRHRPRGRSRLRARSTTVSTPVPSGQPCHR